MRNGPEEIIPGPARLFRSGSCLLCHRQQFTELFAGRAILTPCPVTEEDDHYSGKKGHERALYNAVGHQQVSVNAIYFDTHQNGN